MKRKPAKSENALSAFASALSIQRNAAQLGFDWDDVRPVLNKAREEIDELQDAIEQNDKDSIQREFGDLLFVMVNLSRHLDLPLAESLSLTNEKFKSRFDFVKRRAAQNDIEMQQANIDVLERFWNQAKKAEQ